MRDEDRARELLLQVARDPTPQLAHDFDKFFYPRALRYVKLRHRGFGTAPPHAPTFPIDLTQEKLAEIAHVTAQIACTRARASAREFDPERGSADAWVMRNAARAFWEVAAALEGRRRKFKVVPTDDEELHRHVDEARQSPDPHEIAVARERLIEGFRRLTVEERHVVILCHRDGHTKKEVAEILYRDPSKAKRIDRLLQSAVIKLRQDPPTTQTATS